MPKTNDNTAEERARRRVKEYTDLMWHVATFVIVNGFLWGLDIYKGDGVNWAFWVTIGWGVGLAFHAAAYFIGNSGPQSRRYQRVLAEELAKDDQ
jgi:hypothetical protein